MYLIYKGEGEKSTDLYTAWFDGKTWYGNTKIKDQPGRISPESDYNPGTAVYNKRLYLVYRDKTSKDLYTASFDGKTWYGDTKIQTRQGTIKPKYNPGVLVFDEKLYLVYKSEESGDLYSVCYDGSRWTRNKKISEQFGDISPECDYSPSLSLLYTPPGTMASWLQAVPDNKLIGDINVPGTHDSAAINPNRVTPWACHYNSIPQQLDDGVRLLDIRLKVEQSGSAYTFMTCHSKIGLGLDLNVFQSFISVLDECKEFLESNPTEFIAMMLQVEDWNGTTDKVAAYTKLTTLLHSPHLIHGPPRHGYGRLLSRLSRD